ncbi:MAG: DeoR/GlpR family DNA-binding transcription regulator [Planctomycetota bacterium]|jgi:DeoR family fructose operon transcriptional repressor|nr:DeoR/GlpR family DNA-binding transcription regulator [Planctomycetota bacterium]
MLKDERLEKIEEYVNSNRYASLHELAGRFAISKATIRRDLEALERKKRVVLTRGGASSINKGSSYELPYFEKRQSRHEEKVRIARAACRRIRPGETVMIDSGTTGYEMADFMADIRGVYAATNDLMTALALTKHPDLDLIVIGGNVRKGFYTAHGYFAAADIGNYYFDRAFLCVDAINLKYGCMITNADEVDVKQGIINSAKEVTVICDHSKFAETAFVSVGTLDKVHGIITGRELDRKIYDAFTEKGCRIELV